MTALLYGAVITFLHYFDDVSRSGLVVVSRLAVVGHVHHLTLTPTRPGILRCFILGNFYSHIFDYIRFTIKLYLLGPYKFPIWNYCTVTLGGVPNSGI